PFLAPDLAVIDPKILTHNTDTLIDSGLTCLAACCEAHVLSGNPPARAYAATGIELIMENFMPLVKNILIPGVAQDKGAVKSCRARLTHASVITGIILANCKELLSIQLGKGLANHCTATPGQAMAILLPAVLDLMAKDSDLGSLALPLSGLDEFSATPLPQRPGIAIQKIQSLLNELYKISLGTIPRTLGDTGLDREAISSLAQTLFSDPIPPGTDIWTIDPKQTEAVLARAFDGRALTQAHLNQD
ncbi:MAG: iron-containing alcohol dehydrogenase, partial [Desulfobacteraceae bacterium]|nr:iron-containing alcohol dehydrogenase [Desulfobacteraceae bacterium]